MASHDKIPGKGPSRADSSHAFSGTGNTLGTVDRTTESRDTDFRHRTGSSKRMPEDESTWSMRDHATNSQVFEY